jgi:hypothetical protein
MPELEPTAVPPALTERQQRIVERLDELSPTLADLFRAAVREVLERRDSSWIRLASHACREVVNRLPDYLDLPVAAQRLDYAMRFREIAARWPEDLSDQPPREVVELVARLVEDDRAASASVRARAEALFEALETGELVYAGDAAARAELWVELQRYFPTIAHLSAPGLPDPNAELFQKNFARLERLLASQFRAERFYETQADLDALLEKDAPDEDDVDAVVALLRGELYRTFFERAVSPRWLPLLKARGFFRRPPRRVVDAQYIRYPGWPESRYLVAIAPDAPDEVAVTIVELQPTDNPRVHSDLLEAALLMSPGEAARIAALAGEWLDDSFLMLVPNRAAQLVAKLAEGGEIDAAARLSRQLLALREVPAEFDSGFGALFDVKARVDDWEYQQFLQNQFPRLVDADPTGAMRILRDVLRAAIVMERKRWQTARDDGMKIVRNRIDQHEPFPAVENALITALRDAIVMHVRAHPEDAVLVSGLLEELPELLFRRLQLHLAAEAAAPQLDGVRRELLLDPDLSTHYASEYEYERLLERTFDTLDIDVKRQLLDRIEAGPDDAYRELVRERIAEDHQPSDAELEKRWERWRLRRLAPITDSLRGEDAERYAARVAQYGEPTYPEITTRTSDFPGYRGLLGLDELRQMSGEDIIHALGEWTPAGDGWEAPSREGQARALDVLIDEEPEAWAARASSFTALPPIYARHLLQVLESAIRSEKQIDSWVSLLELADHVVNQQQEDGAQSTYDDDADYQPARRTLAHFVHTALVRQVVPFEHRERLWAVIAALAHDSDPSADQDSSTRDPASSTINRTRGIAILAAVIYGLWCSRSAGGDRSLEALPELRELLQGKLDPDQEASPSVHAAFGQLLPQLLYLDAEWTREHLDQIFPTAPGLSSRRAAAWASFIRYARANAGALRLLLPEFHNAITQLPDDEPERLGDNHTRLAEYVGEIYLDDLDDPDDSVVGRFFSSASAAYRTHAIRHIGLAFNRGRVTDANRERLADLWEHRFEQLPDGDPELSEYGWWFSYQQLNRERSLALLAMTLEKSGGVIDNIREVVEALVPATATAHEEVLRSLDLMIHGSEWYLLDYARDPMRTVLETVFGTGAEAHKEQARRMIHDLGERGVHGMQDLLTANPPQEPAGGADGAAAV